MGASKNPAAYLDVDAILRAARDAGGATFHAETAQGARTPGAGLNWLQRARYYLKILRDRGAAFGTSTATPFDDLRMVRRCGCRDKCQRADPTECEGHIIDIHVGVDVVRGSLFSHDGQPLATTAAPISAPPLSPLMSEALAAKRALGLIGEEDPE
jgi:hypothetical protein